jgi:hypothetical protein
MRPRFFDGYIILALCFINMVVMQGVNGSFSVYYLALLENFGWSHSDGASCQPGPGIGRTDHDPVEEVLMPKKNDSGPKQPC